MIIRGKNIPAYKLPAKVVEKGISKVKEIYNHLYGEYCAQKKKGLDRAESTIEAAFIVQLPEIWNKEQAVFETMLRDARFSPRLIVVPSYDFANDRIRTYGEELDYFTRLYGSRYILTAKELGEDFSGIRRQKFDYVFYQRCWEAYLPKALRSHELNKYFKLCYIPYCFHMFLEPRIYYKTPFFENMYITFASSSGQYEAMRGYGFKRAVFMGFPSLEDSAAAKREGTRALKNVLWTPRWREEDEYGGSSFFRYKESIFELQKRIQGIRLIFRPHPMLFENAIKENKMTAAEVENYKNRCLEQGIIIDTNANIDDTLRETDILLTDFSSIIMNAFMQGIPIVYLNGLPDLEPYEPFRSVMSLLYYSENWENAVAYVASILRGQDVMEEARLKLIDRVVLENKNSPDRILQYLSEA